MFTLNQLIDCVPKSDDLDAMSDWFSDVRRWAQSHNQEYIQNDADSGLFFIGNPSRVEEYRRKILSQLKTVAKESMDMDDKIKVFVVHGHDEALKQKVARYLEKQGYEAIILHEQANKGRTIIEKLEQTTNDVRYAVILYTADDDGTNGQKRARQNVVFEHGYLTNKLGRNHVCVIMDENIEKPSDNSGVLYIPISDWETQLGKEMKAAGLPFDMNKVL